MADATRNLTTDERKALKDGAVIEWQRLDGTWQLGTVETVTTFGWIRLYDADNIAPNASVRLVSAEPAMQRDVNVRGLDGDGVRFPTAQKPPDAPKATEPAKAPPPAESAPEGKETGNLTLTERLALKKGDHIEWIASDGMPVQGMVHSVTAYGVVWASDYEAIIYPDKQLCRAPPAEISPATAAASQKKRGRVVTGKGRGWNLPKKDAELWLCAVRAVRDAMESGMDRPSAVRGISELQEYQSLGMTVATFAWWQTRFIREGKLTKPRKTMPRKTAGERVRVEPVATAEQSDPQRLLLAAINERDQLRVAIRETQAELAAERETRGMVLEELVETRAELTALLAAKTAEAQTITVTFTGLGEVLSRLVAGER